MLTPGATGTFSTYPSPEDERRRGRSERRASGIDGADDELLSIVGLVGGDSATSLSTGVFGSRDDWALEEVVSFDFVSKIALNRLDMEAMKQKESVW
jgi:hypothetical protein